MNDIKYFFGGRGAGFASMTYPMCGSFSIFKVSNLGPCLIHRNIDHRFWGAGSDDMEKNADSNHVKF